MMKSLRKDTGGYALLYVMVIVFVLCAISMTICTVALRNLQSQEASVKRMEEKYAAEGEIEKIKAIAEDISALGVTGQYDNAAEKYIAALKTKIGDGYSFTAPENLAATATGIAVSVKSSAGTDIVVSAAFTIDLVYQAHAVKTGEVDSNGNHVTKTEYSIQSVSTSFTSYTIENTGGGT